MSLRTNLSLALAFALLLTLTVACRQRPAPPGDGGSNAPLVVTTTTMLTDLTRELAPQSVRVEGIMQPGGDPHLYRPTPSDARLIVQSRLVVRNGLHLEGWIDDLVANAGGTRPVVTASEGVDPIQMQDFAAGVDPHFWFDAMLWATAVDNVAAGLQQLVGDGDEHDEIARRRDVLRADLETLHGWVTAAFASIPESRRVLVTSHDAFNYLGRAYAIDVHGVQGLSTEQEAAQRDVVETIDLVRSRQVAAVFVETSVNPAIIRQIATETGARVSGPLYSDSLGDAGSGAETYFGMVRANVTMIVEGLGGTLPAWPFEGRR